jgi:hypothetical protein
MAKTAIGLCKYSLKQLHVPRLLKKVTRTECCEKASQEKQLDI